jgi:hypothetical protein
MRILTESSAASYTPSGVSAITMSCTLADGYSEPQILLQQAGDQCMTDQCGCAASLPNDQNLQVQDAGRQDHKDNLLRPAPAQTKQVRDSLMAGDNTGMTTTELPKNQVVIAIYFRHNNTTHLYKFPS